MRSKTFMSKINLQRGKLTVENRKSRVDVNTINQFKARLDKFWLHHDILYDYTADLTGIGDRSVHVTKDE